MPKRQDNPSPQELKREAGEIERGGKGHEEGKNPKNVAGGKKAAATRKEHGSSSKRREPEE